MQRCCMLQLQSSGGRSLGAPPNLIPFLCRSTNGAGLLVRLADFVLVGEQGGLVLLRERGHLGAERRDRRWLFGRQQRRRCRVLQASSSVRLQKSGHYVVTVHTVRMRRESGACTPTKSGVAPPPRALISLLLAVLLCCGACWVGGGMSERRRRLSGLIRTRKGCRMMSPFGGTFLLRGGCMAHAAGCKKPTTAPFFGDRSFLCEKGWTRVLANGHLDQKPVASQPYTGRTREKRSVGVGRSREAHLKLQYYPPVFNLSY